MKSPFRKFNDGFDVDEPTTGSTIKGLLLKFRDTDYLVNGVDHLEEDAGPFSVISMTTMWTRWEGDKPFHKVTQPGQPHPRRDELPDQDPAAWPKNKNNEKVDPWQDTRNIVMVDDKSATTYTFSGTSIGARIAVSELKDAIKLRRRARPGCFPIVELSTMKMKTRFGERLRPHFKVVGWHDPEVQAEAPAPLKPLAPAAIKNVYRGEPTAGELMSDDIPFAPEWR
jgi:hypothetical protein